jgi:hypothetical protein
MAKATRKPAEAVSTRYTALPHALLDSVAFMGASHRARSLLLDLMRQHNGGNNGHIQAATGWLQKRGWASIGQIQKAKAELVERGLIVRTKAGGLNAGADLYALTWLPVSNFVGLDISANQYHQGAWSLLNPLPLPGSKGSGQTIIVKGRKAANRVVKKREACSVERNGTVPPDGMATLSPVPPDGTKTAIFRESTVPPDGNNECLPLPTRKLKRIVGRKRAEQNTSGLVPTNLA